MKLYHVTTIDSAKKIMKDGACSKKSEQQSGGFYLWTSFERAKKYTSDDYILNKGNNICILVFDLEFNTNDFDLDYEISGPWIRKWADENLKKITEEAEKLGYKLMPSTSEGLNHYWRRDEPFHAVIMPDPSPGSFSGKSERFLKFLSQLGLLDELEIWAVNYKKHAPAVKYMKTERIFPNEILDKDGEKLNLSLNESILIAESQLRRIIRQELIRENENFHVNQEFPMGMADILPAAFEQFVNKRPELMNDPLFKEGCKYGVITTYEISTGRNLLVLGTVIDGGGDYIYDVLDDALLLSQLQRALEQAVNTAITTGKLKQTKKPRKVGIIPYSEYEWNEDVLGEEI